MKTQLRAVLLSLVLACTLAGMPGGAFAAAKRVALVIGNNAYQKATALSNCANDARALHTALLSLGFQVQTLIDADRSTMDKGLSWLEGQVSDAELAIFFFSGHGVQVNGLNYLVPVDADVGNEPQVKRQAINANQVADDLRGSGCKTSVLILDACRNDPFSRRFRGSGTRGLAAMQPAPGSLIAFAADAGQVADDNPSESNGLYTSELLKHLTTPGVRLEDVFIRTRRGVLQRSGNKQAPAEYSMLLQEIHMSAPGAAEPDRAVPAPAPAPVSPDPSRAALQPTPSPSPVSSASPTPSPTPTPTPTPTLVSAPDPARRPDPKTCFALCVGVGTFSKHPSDNVFAPPLDVRAFRAFLVDQMRVPKSHVRTLVDAQASRNEVSKQLRWLASQASPGNTLYVYWSGTALAHDTGGLLAPYDYEPDPGGDKTPSEAAQPPNNVYRQNDLRLWLESVLESRVVLVIDAMQSGAMAGRLLGRRITRQLSPDLPGSVALLAACDWNGSTYFADKGSLFTNCLLEKAKLGLPLSELARSVREMMEPEVRAIIDQSDGALRPLKDSDLPVLHDFTGDPGFVPFWGASNR